MIRITKVEPLPEMYVRITFDDGIVKIVDVGAMVKGSVFQETFENVGFFKAVKRFDNGRGIYWPNDFDLCPDTLRYYTEGVIEQPAVI